MSHHARFPSRGLACWCSAALLLVSTRVCAQQMTGNLQFTVTDSLGEPIPGVNALVTGSSVQGVRGASSDARGICFIPLLPPGNVSVRISHAAYQQALLADVLIALGKTTNLGEIRLGPQMLNLPELVISGVRPVIDPRTTAYGSNLRQADFEYLPVDRNYRSMIALLPQSNASAFGDAVNVAGATGHENKYVVDGTDVTDPLIAADGMTLPYNFIREIEVKAGGYEADSYSSLGGVLNVITNSGGNELHGSAFGFYTSNRLTGNPRLGLSDPTQGATSNYDVGFGIGGPIIRDALWFFVAYNPTYTTREVEVPSFGTYVDKTVVNSFATKFTWRATEQFQLVVTANGDPVVQNAVGNGIDVPPAALTSVDSYLMNVGYGSLSVSLQGTYTAGSHLVINGSVARLNRHDTGEPATESGKTDPFFKDVQTNTVSGGPLSSWDSFRYCTMGKLGATLNASTHTVTLGVEYKGNGTDNHYRYDQIYKVDSASYYESVGAGTQTVHDHLPSVYLQDNWQISGRVNLHAGVRWEGQYIVGSDGKVDQRVTLPLLPRIGITFVPDAEGVQKVSASFGRFSEEFALFQPMNLFSDQSYGYTIHFVNDPRTSRSGADTVGGGPGHISPGVEGLRGQYFDEFSLSYERAILGNLRIGFQGLYRTLRQTIDDAYLSSQNSYRFGNPGEGLLADWPKPRREYMALVLTIERHADDHFNFLASYVLSRNYGNYGGIYDASYHIWWPNFGTAFDDINTTKQYGMGLLPNDRTHVFKFLGSYRFDFGLATGISFIAQSGTPLSEFVNRDNYVQLVSPRGSAGRTPAIWDLSMRLLYDFPESLLGQTRVVVDVFHIASQRKPIDIQQVRGYMDASGVLYPEPTYGEAYRYQAPMSLRLGMEVRF